MLAVSFLNKRITVLCLQIGCFALCFVFCALFMFHTSTIDSVPQDAMSVNIDSTKTKVIIDAGHGGEDSGAVGIDGVLEKDLNLAVSSILSELMLSSGIEVYQTRTEDVMLGNGEAGHKKQEDLRARVDIGKEISDAYYISIHMNKFPKEYCKGVQLFYSPNNSQSLSLAGSLHQMVLTYLQPDNNREIKNGSKNIYLLNRLQNPAILVECGFVSNSEEAALLQNSDYQKKLALVIMASVFECEYKNQIT